VFNALFWWAVKNETGSTAMANEKSLESLTAYLIEKSLAVDNIFVFLLIFTYFAVPPAFQKRVLMIGIIGAIVLRTIMILVGGWLAAGAVPLDSVHLRCFPHPHRREDVVGLTDVIFAVDSIPAIFAITKDPFIVLTSNVFAILGLRAMFFLLQAAASRFHLLNYGLAVILVFIGTKMMLIDIFKIPVAVSLGVVLGILAITMIWSSKTAPNT